MAFYEGNHYEDYFHGVSHRRFYRKLYFETFRHMGFINKCLKKYLQKDPGAGAKAALALGITQLIFIRDVPDYAAVNESVGLIKDSKRGLVNAVMRKVIADRDTLLEQYTPADEFPQWLMERWNKRYGKKNVQSFYSCMNEAPQMYAVNKVTAEISKVEDFDEPDPELYYMDAASATIPTLAGDVKPFRILDCCAAPGGKTMVLSRKYPDAQIFAVEKSKKRFEKLKEFVKELGLSNVTVVNADINAFEAGADFDLVLLDAPCSALGTIRKHPEVRWLRKPADLKRNNIIQKEMIEKVSGFVSDGGALIYSVCTFEPEETVDIVNPFMESHTDYKLTAPNCDPALVNKDGFFESMICKSGFDGFFAAVMKKS